MTRSKVCIVGCTAHKRDVPMRAEQLYCSDLFYKSRRYAQANFDTWLILSAKHGLVKPCDILAPYDCKLTTLSSAEQIQLAAHISQQAAGLFEKANVEITSICVEEYDHLLEQANVNFTRSPEFALPIGNKLKSLGRATDPHRTKHLLDATYRVIRQLEKKFGLRKLPDVLENKMPDSGVYLFFDEREKRLKNIDQLRVVRVGTHGVAAGSKASLRNRMRTHFGTISGEGNHRSSIFRLHTG